MAEIPRTKPGGGAASLSDRMYSGMWRVPDDIYPSARGPANLGRRRFESLEVLSIESAVYA
jgi:hypothetical protein